MGSDLGALLDLGWKLLLVLGLTVLAMRALRWLSIPTLNSDSPLKVVARLPIGPQQTVIVVSVGRKNLLLGQTTNQITLLAEIAADELVTATAAPRVAAPSRTFAIGGHLIRLGELTPIVDKGLALLSKFQRPPSPESPTLSRPGHEPASSAVSGTTTGGDGT